MAVVKVLNTRGRLASTEILKVYLYAHTAFLPETGLSITADVYNATTLLGSVTFEEDFFVPGVYLSDVEDQLGTLAAGEYTVVIIESGNEVGVVDFIKGADLSMAEGGSVDNKRIESNFSAITVGYRKVVPGSLDHINVKTKQATDDDFSNPLTDGNVYFSYKNPTPRSDYVLSSPIIVDPASVVPVYVDPFEALQWMNAAYHEPYEDSTWFESAFEETFENNNWL
jgi:hypothetical protein